MDVSNKTLALILVIATSISLLGTLITLDTLGSGGGSLTGRATDDTATTNFSINSTVAVAFTVTNVEFGAGIVNATGDHNCTLNTTGAGMLAGGVNPTGGPDCIGFNATIPPLRIQNQGTQNVTLNLSFNATAAIFIGGTSPSFTFRALNNDTGACGNVSSGSGSINLNNAQTQISAANTNFSICNSTALDWRPTNRTLSIDLGIKIPQDVQPGARRVTITAYASNP
jgi:hypothetical protein